MQILKRPIAVLIEDDPAFRELVQIYLEKVGFEVATFREGRTALAQIEGLKPDLVCLDLMLPRMSGYEICEAIRRMPSIRAVPVLFMSSRGLPTDRAHAEEAGGDGYLVKPFPQADFVAQVVGLVPGLARWIDA